MKELNTIQCQISVAKNQRNTFGKYNYRSCEDILEALKPFLKKEKCTLVITDDIVMIGHRFYVKAVCTLINSAGEVIKNQAFAREAETKKGMDEGQLSGATSSYARKYALAGLFLLDDNKDADTMDNGGSNQSSNLINDEQVKRLYSLGDQNYIQQIYVSFGYSSAKLIEQKNYDAICALVNPNAQQTQAPAQGGNGFVI
tara:strand:+ start:1074 stop:1673 length:600 start_codon:yes stop_codon:yes gene_type:complete